MSTFTVQGRQICDADIELIRRLQKDHPDWHRTRLSQAICLAWEWRTENGQLKDIACRSMLRKLEARKLIKLPVAKHNGRPWRRKFKVDYSQEPISGPVGELLPIRLLEVRDERSKAELFRCLLSEHHSLGLNSVVGETMRYLAFDRHERVLGCLLFGAAAWKVRDRDEFIAWDAATREVNLPLVVNNSRFLIVPWATVPNLASVLLSRAVRQRPDDYLRRDAHPVYLAETFVERSRFRGTCYRAANWVRVGQSQGRSREDRRHRLQVPVKDIYVYALDRDFRTKLQRVERG